jgi:uncharacterized membrane protein
MIQIAVIVLASLGFFLSALFALVGMGIVGAQDPRLPAVCRMDERSCASILRSADARVFGIPNVALGLAYYGGLIMLAVAGDPLMDLMGFLVVVGGFTVVLGIYLTVRLLRVHHVQCGVCFTSHFINLFLCVTFLVGL